MRRGHSLEIQLARLFKYLNSRGIHAHKNHAERTVDGAYRKGEPFDFEIFVNPVHVFDAKECAGVSWSLANAKTHQVDNLCKCAAHGAEAYFLVLFEGRELRRFDAADVADAIAHGRKSLGKEEGAEWKWENLIK